MHKKIGIIVLALAASIAWTAAARAESILGYEPKADPFVQYHRAVAQAQAENKLVLIIAGGDWCSWCYRLDRFVKNNDDVRRQLEDTFVTMKVYVGDENYNSFFFSQLPEARGAPHFWVIAPDKRVLSSQPTAELEAKKGYDKNEFLSFIERWKNHADTGTLERHAAAR